MRVSRSGRLMSTTTPWPKRERRRSSSASSSRGGRSDVMHDLLAGLVERVERVEELDLRLLLLGQELHVVDEQDVVLAVRLLEALDAALVGDGVDEVVGEALDRDVLDLQLGVVVQHGVGDGLDEVGLAEAGVGVDEHRVVGGGRRLGDAARHGRGVLVVRAGDEAVEDVAGVEVRGGAARARGARGWGLPPRRLGRRRGVGSGGWHLRLRQLGGALVDDDAHVDGVAEHLAERLGHARRGASRSSRGRSRWARR